MLMASLIIVPIIFGIILYKLPLKLGKILFLVVQVLFNSLAVFLFLETERTPYMYEILGGDSYILNTAIRGDRLSLLLVVVTVFLFTVASLYKIRDRFYDGKLMLLFLILQGLTVGLFLTDDLFNLFILFEVSTVVTTLLVMFKKKGRVVYDALYYLVTQMVSMMFFLFGIAYLYRIFGVLSIEHIANAIPYSEVTDLILPFSFMMAGLCFKLGMFPMFGWVSRAYGLNSAPISQLAIMSSMLMKTSLYWFLRISVMFGEVLDYSRFWIMLGILSAVIGAVKAVSQKDIRLMLAYSTVSQIGLIVFGIFIGDEVSYLGSMYHIVSHAIFKMILFLSAGLIIRQYRTANIYEIRGVFKKLPLVSFATIVAILSIVGFPLTSASVSKYFIAYGIDSFIFELVFWMMSFGTMLVFVKYSQMFFGNDDAPVRRIGFLKNFSVLVLTIVCLVSGILMQNSVNFLLWSDLSISFNSFVVKSLVWIGMAGVAVLLYIKVLHKRTKFLYDNWEHSLSFSNMILVFVVFFMMLVGYGLMVIL